MYGSPRVHCSLGRWVNPLPGQTFLHMHVTLATLFAAIRVISLLQRIYRIYSINRPGRLLNFWTLFGRLFEVGAYSNKYGKQL